ncbi:hypothetical protein PC112_g25748, partial [Phytophthora cactorum]
RIVNECLEDTRRLDFAEFDFVGQHD